jgi:hypothetical protein
MDSAKQFQVDGNYEHLPVSPLSLWERVRVRAIFELPQFV